jgi:para-nitrobenzyl esterase
MTFDLLNFSIMKGTRMKMNRRSFIGQTGIGTAALGVVPAASMTSCAASQTQESPQNDAPILQIGDNIAVAETAYGKVKGFILRDVYTFLGIPYGDDMSGKNRFMPPQKPKPWDDVRPAVFYGNSAPQNIYNRSPESYSAFIDHWNYDEISEDCLRLNVWSPGLDAKNRPVMVWLHGGGYRNGNGIEHDGYHGENFSKYGDAVFCSINHRLGPIGFSDFSSVGGEKYKHSGNAGMLDIIEALRWINENIANFGGDPGNVTVMGQSGGGSKVSTVAAMPAAKGLVHKGVPLSGSSIESGDRAVSQKIGEYILKEAGLKPSQIDKLQDMPWKNYLDLTDRAAKKYAEENPGAGRAGFRPVGDDIHIPSGRFFSNDSADKPNIPMLFCTTFNESSPSRTDASLEDITLEGIIEKLHGNYGEKTTGIVAAYSKAFPECKPVEIWSLISSNRTRVVQAANAKTGQSAPVYMAWFGWQPPLFDNRMRAFHCVDICFWYNNTDLMLSHTGGGARPRALSHKMADALLNFMRNGDPNGGALPFWPAYSVENGETMVLNDESSVQNDPDREARRAIG